ncbi:MAG TPA: hypothetical protein VK188_14365 [Holophaga sp.]|nr:hypothetical protein [Holophaga sp.]
MKMKPSLGAILAACLTLQSTTPPASPERKQGGEAHLAADGDVQPNYPLLFSEHDGSLVMHGSGYSAILPSQICLGTGVEGLNLPGQEWTREPQRWREHIHAGSADFKALAAMRAWALAMEARPRSEWGACAAGLGRFLEDSAWMDTLEQAPAFPLPDPAAEAAAEPWDASAQSPVRFLEDASWVDALGQAAALPLPGPVPSAATAADAAADPQDGSILSAQIGPGPSLDPVHAVPSVQPSVSAPIPDQTPWIARESDHQWRCLLCRERFRTAESAAAHGATICKGATDAWTSDLSAREEGLSGMPEDLEAFLRLRGAPVLKAQPSQARNGSGVPADGRLPLIDVFRKETSRAEPPMGPLELADEARSAPVQALPAPKAPAAPRRRRSYRPVVQWKLSPGVQTTKGAAARALVKQFHAQAAEHPSARVRWANDLRKWKDFCVICRRVLDNGRDRRDHVALHEAQHGYTCPHDGCGASFESQDRFKNHPRVHLAGCLWPCDACEEAGFSRAELESRSERLRKALEAGDLEQVVSVLKRPTNRYNSRVPASPRDGEEEKEEAPPVPRRAKQVRPVASAAQAAARVLGSAEASREDLPAATRPRVRVKPKGVLQDRTAAVPPIEPSASAQPSLPEPPAAVPSRAKPVKVGPVARAAQAAAWALESAKASLQNLPVVTRPQVKVKPKGVPKDRSASSPSLPPAASAQPSLPEPPAAVQRPVPPRVSPPKANSSPNRLPTGVEARVGGSESARPASSRVLAPLFERASQVAALSQPREAAQPIQVSPAAVPRPVPFAVVAPPPAAQAEAASASSPSTGSDVASQEEPKASPQPSAPAFLPAAPPASPQASMADPAQPLRQIDLEALFHWADHRTLTGEETSELLAACNAMVMILGLLPTENPYAVTHVTGATLVDLGVARYSLYERYTSSLTLHPEVAQPLRAAMEKADAILNKLLGKNWETRNPVTGKEAPRKGRKSKGKRGKRKGATRRSSSSASSSSSSSSSPRP